MKNTILIIFLTFVFTLASTVIKANEKKSNGEVNHRIPKTYTGAVRTLETLEHELKELAEAYRLYQFHEPLELVDAIIKHLPNKAEANIYGPMRNEVRDIARDISHIAEELDSYSDKDDAKGFSKSLHTLHDTIELLDKYAPLSNEHRATVAHNVPPTYKRTINRMRGVYNALKDILSKGYLYKAHEDIEHIGAAAHNLTKIFESNVIDALKTRLDRNLSIMIQFSIALHQAGDAEDRDEALHAFSKKVSNALHKLEELGATGHSLESILDKADGLFSRLKLLKPAGGNAYELYRNVLNKAPQNARAKAGIQNIVDWYLHKIEELSDSKDWNKVSIYSKRVLSIDPNNTKAKQSLVIAKANHKH